MLCWACYLQKSTKGQALMNTHSLFIYGTLLDDEVLSKVLGHDCHSIQSVEAEAPFMRVFKVAHVDYPCLLQGQDNDVAEGALLTGLSDDDIAKLDQFEGDNYQRVAIDIIAENRLVASQAYQPLTALETDGSWSFDRWSKEGRRAFLAHDFNKQGVRKPNEQTS